jgi:TPR repeat protein
VSEESQLQIKPKSSDSSLVRLSEARSSLIARGRNDAARLNDLESRRQTAEQGYAEEQFTLGTIYHYGDGVSPDYAEAAKWYLKAAEQGHDEAQFKLGALYTHGQGVEQDHITAAEWYVKAAKQRHGLAQFNIGVMYQNGDGIERDYSLAARWYRMSAELGGSPSGKGPPLFDPRLLWQQEVTEEYWEFALEFTEASEWYSSVLHGVPSAQFNLGVLYEAGAGVSQDYLLAYLWMKVAADRPGDDSARFAAGRDRVLATMNGTEAAEAETLTRSLETLDLRHWRVRDSLASLPIWA